MNIENFRKVLNHITENPDEWDQEYWRGVGRKCFCFAGHAEALAGLDSEGLAVRKNAKAFLGLDDYEADYLFDHSRVLGDFELKLAAEEIELAAEEKRLGS
jgi:hypothetical protein